VASPLQLALIISAIDNASAPLRKVQQQMQSIVSTGLKMTALGIGMLAPVKSVVAAGIEAQRSEMQLQRLLPGGIEGRNQLAQAEQFAVEMTEHHLGSMGELNATLAENYALTNSMTAAIERTRQAEALATATSISMSDANRVLREGNLLFGESYQHVSDLISKASTLAPPGFVEQLTNELPRLGAFLEQNRIRLQDFMATSIEMSRAGVPTRMVASGIRQAIEAVLPGGALSRLGVRMPITVDATGHMMLGATFVDIRNRLTQMQVAAGGTAGAFDRIPLSIMNALGPGARQIFQMSDVELQKLNGDLGNVTGTTARLSALQEAMAGPQAQILSQSWGKLKEAIGTALVPAFTALVAALTPVVIWMRKFAEANPWLVRMVGIGLAVAGSFLILGGGALVLIGTIGSLVLAFQGAFAVMGIVGTIAASTIFWWAALAAGVGYAAFVIYNNWDKIKSILSEAYTWMRDAGSRLMIELANGITAVASLPITAFWKIAQKLHDMIPFSPAKEGPLRDLHKARFIETLAGTIRGDSLVGAMSHALANLPGAPGVGIGPMSRRYGGGYDTGAPIYFTNAPSITVTMPGGSAGDKADLERRLADLLDRNTGKVADALDRFYKRRNRMNLY
jgi:hypothetical protein